jgi:hypothetical protein
MTLTDNELPACLPACLIRCAAMATLQDVWKQLVQVEVLGGTCCGGAAEAMPRNPRLHIKGVGDVTLPLNADQVGLSLTLSPHHSLPLLHAFLQSGFS